MLTKPISICVMLAGALGIAGAVIDNQWPPVHFAILACGCFLVGASLIALAVIESANKK